MVWITCDVFISCLDSHSDGTHSLQRIHWRATFLQIWWRNKLIRCPEGEYILSNFHYRVNCSFKILHAFKTSMKKAIFGFTHKLMHCEWKFMLSLKANGTRGNTQRINYKPKTQLHKQLIWTEQKNTEKKQISLRSSECILQENTISVFLLQNFTFNSMRFLPCNCLWNLPAISERKQSTPNFLRFQSMHMTCNSKLKLCDIGAVKYL